MYNFVSIATNIFDVIVTFMFYQNFLNWKTEKRLNHFLCGIFMFSATFISNIFILEDKILAALTSITILLIITLWFQDRIAKKILVVIGYMILVMVSDIITTLIMMRFLHFNVNALLNVAGTERILAMIISKPVILCLVKLISLFKNKEEIVIYRKYWIALLTIPIVNIALLISITNFFDYMQNINVITVYVTTICILYNNLLTFYLFDRIIGIFALKNKCDILENQIIIQSEHVKINESENKKFACIRHDLKIHFQTLYNMLKTQNYHSALKYLADTEIVSDTAYSKVHTGNIAFDSIFNTKLAEAEEKGITINTKCIIPKDIFMSELDICILFGNLLDNAIEGCLRCEQQNKYINTYIQYKDNRLICCIQNTSLNGIKKEGETFKSSKLDANNHGIGIYNIKNVVLKYDGICKMQNENNKFTVTMTLFNI